MAQKDASTRRIRNVAFVLPRAHALRHAYNPLATAVRGNGDVIRCFSPNIAREDAAALHQQGIPCTEFSLEPDRFAILRQRSVTTALARLLREWRTDVIVVAGGLEMIVGAHAAKLAGVSQIIAIADALPESENDTGSAGNRKIAPQRYARALKLASSVVCLNGDDANRLRALNWLPPTLPITVTPGCGINLDTYRETPLPPLDSGLVFQMIAPLDEANGVLTYCEAAEVVKTGARSAKFLLSGPPSHGPGAIALEELEPYSKSVDYGGLSTNTQDELAHCHVFVCPSQFDPLPLNGLQALAIGRPIIASTAPGYRELVDERVNGCLVSRGSVRALVEAMESFLRRPDLIPAMARASRQKAQRRFEETAAVASFLHLLGSDEPDHDHATLQMTES